MIERFTNKFVITESGCWEWQAARDRDGYGLFTVGLRSEGTKRQQMAHRFAYESVVGPIAAGLQLDHLCRNRACVNPDHLEPVTCQTNVLRGDTAAARNANKQRCERSGHPLTGTNLWIDPAGHRQCRACRNAAVQRYRARRRIAVQREQGGRDG